MCENSIFVFVVVFTFVFVCAQGSPIGHSDSIPQADFASKYFNYAEPEVNISIINLSGPKVLFFQLIHQTIENEDYIALLCLPISSSETKKTLSN